MQHRNKTNGKNGNCVNHPCKLADLSPSDIQQGNDLEHPCVSFTTVDVTTDNDTYWPVLCVDEPVTSFRYLSYRDNSTNSSGLLGDAGGVTDEWTDSLNFMIERWPVQGPRLREYVNRVSWL